MRSKETMQRYREWSKENKGYHDKNPLQHLMDKPIKRFEHWLIIENEFPYDAIAETHHMLVPKRELPFDWENPIQMK